MTLTPPPLSLYVHVPWCVRKCPYCDFNSHEFKSGKSRGELPFAAYVDALLADLDHDLPLVWGRTVQTVFFGGGTPSLMPPEFIDRFLQGASARLRFAPGCEITLETNPGTAEHGRFEGYRDAGINRLSFGIQSFDDGCLERLGRIHDSREAEAAVKLAQDAGFDNLNYWTYADYRGIGAGAHGKITLGHDQSIRRRWKQKHPTRYLASAGKEEAIGGDDVITPDRRPFEFMLNALRLVDGFGIAMFEARTGVPVAAIEPQLQIAVARGWLERDGGHLRPTELGRRFTNDVVALFLDPLPL